jgi:hypothetical protein
MLSYLEVLCGAQAAQPAVDLIVTVMVSQSNGYGVTQ